MNAKSPASSKWNKATNDIGRGDGAGAGWSTLWIRFLQTKLEMHHKIQPTLTVGRYGRDHGFKPIACQTVAFKYFCNFLNLFVPEIVNFPVLPRLLCPIMFGVRPGRKITPKTHCNGPRDDLRETSGHDDFRGGNGGSEACRQRERHGEAVRHSDYDIPYDFGCSEMLFYVGCGGHGRVIRC